MFDKVGLVVVLLLVIVIHLVVPVSPDYTLPAIPELVSISLLSGFLCVFLHVQKPDKSFKLFSHSLEQWLLALIWFSVLVIIGFRAVWSLFYTPGQVWTPCLSLPVFALKVECFFQASVIQNYGFRTFFTLAMATLFGTLVFCVNRLIPQSSQLLLACIVLGPVLVASVSWIYIALDIDQVLPQSILANINVDSRIRFFTQVFANQSWVWPYFAPALAINLWFIIYSKKEWIKILNISSCILLTSGLLATKQRGAILLLITYTVVCLFYPLLRNLKNKILIGLTLGVFFCIFLSYMFVCYSFEFYASIVNDFLKYRGNPLLFDSARFMMTKAAFILFQDSPWWGHGYASWFQIISNYSQKYKMPYVYDHAHNFFIQIFAELGIFHGILIISIFVLIIIVILQNCNSKSHDKLLLLLAINSFFVPAFVQEVDFIRPTFYLHTIFWGTLLGFRRARVLPDLSIKPRIFFDFVGWIKKICFCVFFISIFLTFFCYLSFSFGASVFEANLTQKGVIARWLTPSVSLAAFKTHDDKAYSVQSAGFLQTPITFEQNHNFVIYLQPQDTDELWLSLENGQGFFPKKHTLSFSPGYRDGGARWLGALTLYPALQSDLGIGWSRGMYGWENLGGRLGRWCTGDCWFLAKSCGVQNRLDFSIFSSRPDLTPTQPLSVNLSTYGLPVGGEFSSPMLNNLPQPLMQKQLQLKIPEERQTLEVVGTPETAWYLVHAQTSSVFNPQVQGFSTDNRDLGVLIAEPDCS